MIYSVFEVPFFFVLVILTFSKPGVNLMQNSQVEQSDNKRGIEESRKVYGRLAKAGEFPYHVILGDRCNGVLIDSKWVLTATSCIDLFKSDEKMAISFTQSSNSGGSDQQTNAQLIVKHPYVDLALVKVPAVTTPNRHPIKISNSIKNITALNVVAAVSAKTGVLIRDLIVKPVTLHPWKCFRLAPLIPINYFCLLEATGSGCNGDSGSPLIVKGANSKEDILIGIVRGGDSKCHVGPIPGMVTKVRRFINWIDKIKDKH